MTLAPDLFKRLKPLYPKAINHFWLEYQTADFERKQEIEGLLVLLAARRQGMGIGDEQIVLEPPQPALIGQGEYAIGHVRYPGLAPYPFRLTRQELMRHVFLLGPSGTGKTTLILGLLQQFLRVGLPFMIFDFKRNYRCLLATPEGSAVTVITVGRDTAPLIVNALLPPTGVPMDAWIPLLADVISASYLLLHGARNVLTEALHRAVQERGNHATLADAHRLLDLELRTLRPGSRRYGWLESSARSLEELSKGRFGHALNADTTATITQHLRIPVIFELEGLGDDQRRFFCLFALSAIQQFRKADTAAREVLRHVLIFDEAQNVFPKDQYGELSLPSRLAREVREFGEGVIAATQQADVADSLIANAGTKIVLRTGHHRETDVAAKILQVEPRWLTKLPVGTGIARLPERYYQSFLFTFEPQASKNVSVPDAVVRNRYDEHWPRQVLDRPSPLPGPPNVSEKELALLADIAQHPIAGVTARYARLQWNAKTGTAVKDAIITKDLTSFETVPTENASIKILTLTPAGIDALAAAGITVPPSRRGGPAHEYWRAVLRQRLEHLGYIVDDEHPVGNGQAVDLHGTKNGHHVYVEIETGKSAVAANIAKCQPLACLVLFFFVTREAAAPWADSIAEMPRARLVTPHDLGLLPRYLVYPSYRP